MCFQGDCRSPQAQGEALAKRGANQKMRGPLRADCAAPPKRLLYYREREWTSKPVFLFGPLRPGEGPGGLGLKSSVSEGLSRVPPDRERRETPLWRTGAAGRQLPSLAGGSRRERLSDA